MFELTFHPGVANEVRASYDWYQRKANGLGEDFISELESAYQAIIEFPRTWPKFQGGFQRFLLARFPFSVIYRNNGNLIYIVAVMHNSRKPDYWLKRS